MHRVLNIDKNKKLIAQFNYRKTNLLNLVINSMIGQCLSNKNENTTMSKYKNFLDLNKALSKKQIGIWKDQMWSTF